jgi:hypothetical protein
MIVTLDEQFYLDLVLYEGGKKVYGTMLGHVLSAYAACDARW